TAGGVVRPVQREGGGKISGGGYFPRGREVCGEGGGLVVVGGNQTGVGGNGEGWCYGPGGVRAGVVRVGRALGSGVPNGAARATENVARVFTPGTHGSTFGGNPFATAVGLTVFSTLVEERLPERAARMGRLLSDRLEAVRAKKSNVVKEVRGKGLLIGVDLSVP